MGVGVFEDFVEGEAADYYDDVEAEEDGEESDEDGEEIFLFEPEEEDQAEDSEVEGFVVVKIEEDAGRVDEDERGDEDFVFGGGAEMVEDLEEEVDKSKGEDLIEDEAGFDGGEEREEGAGGFEEEGPDGEEGEDV